MTGRSPTTRSALGAWFMRVHGPTWIVAVTIYGSWIGLTLAHARVPLPMLAVLGGVVIAWHGSLQHETIHGHPSGPRWLGRALGAPPLSLWLPYEIYRDTHRRHHATHRLADPAHDPEAPTEQSALGRLVLGPPRTIGAFLWSELGAVVRGEPGHRRAWALHALAVALVLLWLVVVARLPLWKYVLAFVYPGASLTLLRSFAEHRADVVPERRTTVVEAGLFFRLLFLNNNLHVAHHAAPRAPWFELPRLWAEQRASVAARAPDLIHAGYSAIVRARLLRRTDEAA
ncbi:MAG: fatty acid desaturase [Labilithrix sp.]|nr:fatty acid desaturase [Labilithrix sp.]MCW5809744.1 fatty acid desaturase [Labilithrix sp.]